MIAPNIWMSLHNQQLIFRQRLFFIGIISNADDEGRIKGDPLYLRAKIFPYDDLKVETILDDIKAVANEGLITSYLHKGLQYIQINKWNDYQTINRPTPSKIPKFNEDSMKAHRELNADSLLKEKKLKEKNRNEYKR